MGHKVDYLYKSYVLREHSDLLDKMLKSERLNAFKGRFIVNDLGEIQKHPCWEYHEKINTMSLTDLFQYVIDNNLLKELQECKKINKARNARVYRLKNKVSNILLSGSAIFLTLTFNDEVLKDSNEKKRKRYVRDFLTSLKCRYVANVDYGKTNHREHYHALVAIDAVNGKGWRKYGNINFERVHIKENDYTTDKLAKYIAKLTNHAIKETTKRCALMYDRG